MFKNKQYIFFDLDGTLIDSEPGITHCAAYALEKMGVAAQTKEQLRRFIGPPLTESFMRFCGMTKEDAVKATAFYRELYRDNGVYMFEVYNGVEQMLQMLKESGKTLILATSKPERFAKKVMERSGLKKYFTHICGSLTDDTRTTKTEVLQFAMESANLQDVHTAVMVGDREYDVFGADDVGMQCMGVLYGFGSEDELNTAGAVALAKTPLDVARILLK
ncbi:MAG: HAD hydrolase-like protein [Clostridia bacterium]|nr:HAD hydrolase-like protein [Clostridia bacterium]